MEEALERVVIAAEAYKRAQLGEDHALARLGRELEATRPGGPLRQADVARACGVSRQVVQEWIRKAERRKARRG